MDEPERCALCGCRGGSAPVLVNLATGGMLELRLAETDERMSLLGGAGLLAQSTAESCRVKLPEAKEPTNEALFCRSCRRKIKDSGAVGYALADLSDAEDIRVYAVENGAEFEAGTYGMLVFLIQ